MDKRVYKNVKLFMENKKDGDDLFDRLNTSVLNGSQLISLIQSDWSEFKFADIKPTVGAEPVLEWSDGWLDSQSFQVKIMISYSLIL